jgi:ribosomal protein S18 acetylase RimI-like enzyme
MLRSRASDPAAREAARFSVRKELSVIRPTVPGDTRAILALTGQTGVFKPHEIQALDEVLADFHATNCRLGHFSVTFEKGHEILGFAYYAPAAMTDRTWYLYWIAVTKQIQARGIGTTLLKYVEDSVREQRGRLLLIETSSLPYYELTRKFYLKHGYQETATIADFYAEGDSMVVYAKRFD